MIKYHVKVFNLSDLDIENWGSKAYFFHQGGRLNFDFVMNPVGERFEFTGKDIKKYRLERFEKEVIKHEN